MNKSYSELGEGTVESKELSELSIGSIRTILGVSVVFRIGQVLSLVVGPCLELVSLMDMWGGKEACFL